eukprot:5009264-Pyramimonas_sp.AAC.1
MGGVYANRDKRCGCRARLAHEAVSAGRGHAGGPGAQPCATQPRERRQDRGGGERAGRGPWAGPPRCGAGGLSRPQGRDERGQPR